MIASHNQVSIEKAVALVQQHGMDPTNSGIFFGQLLGMADHLTLVLGGNGYRVRILIPYARLHYSLHPAALRLKHCASGPFLNSF